MAKDPAFLFYSKDWLSDFQGLTMEERGQYLTLICIQHQNGPLTEKMIRLSCGNAAADVLALFQQDENGLFYNERLKNEIEKRAAHAEKQRTRAVDGWKKRKQSIEEQDVDDKSTISHGNAAALPLVNGNVIANGNEDVIEKEKVQKTKKEKTNDVPTADMERMWSEFLQKHHGISYYANVKERVALRSIAKQLLFQIGQKETQTGQISTKSDQDKVLDAWGYVLSKFDNWSEFHKKLKALSAINSQLTTIISDSKNGTKQKSNGPLDPAKIAADYLRSRGIADPINSGPTQSGPPQTFDADYQVVD